MKNIILLVLTIALITSCNSKPTRWEEYKNEIEIVNQVGIVSKVVEDNKFRNLIPNRLLFGECEFRYVSKDTVELSDGLRFVKNHKCDRYFPVMSDTSYTKDFYVSTEK